MDRKEWVRQHLSVQNWLGRLEPRTADLYRNIAYRYFTWVEETKGLSPEELLDQQDKLTGRERYKQLALLQQWANSQKGRYKTKTVYYSAIRSFYEHNHVPLPRDVTFKMRGDLPPVEGELTAEDLQKIVLSSSVTFQAVFMVMFTSGMGEAEWEHFNTKGWPQIEPQLKKGKERLRVDFPGRKHSLNRRPFYTFIAKDGVECLKRYLKQERGPVGKNETIVLNRNGKPVNGHDIHRYFHRHAVKVGVIKPRLPDCPKCGGDTRRVRRYVEGKYKVFMACEKCGDVFEQTPQMFGSSGTRYGVNPHEMRDLWRSRWELSSAKTIVAEFAMGHDIDPNDYNKIMKLYPDWAEKHYALAEPYFNLLSEDPTKVSVDTVAELKKRIIDLENKNVELKMRLNGQTPELQQLRTELEELRNMIKELAKKQG